MQATIDFTAAERHRENTIANQQHHDNSIDRFARQDRQVYELLKQGHRLTTHEALLKYSIGDLRRRIKTLRDAKVDISDEWVKDDQGRETRFKQYFLTNK